MDLLTQRVGENEVTILSDGLFQAPVAVLIHARGEEALAAALSRLGNPEKVTLEVNCFLVRGPEGITLIDAGVGTVWGDTFGKARAALASFGLGPDSIDRVLVTHIHGDHVLGLVQDGEAWLPRAEILVPDVDRAFFTNAAAREAQPEARRGGFDAAATILKAYEGRVRTYSPGPVPGIAGMEAVSLPGHTPGHTGFLLHGQGESLLIWADALHLREAQPADPELGMAFDTDSGQALATRRDMLERCVRDGLVVAGSHVAGFGRIERAGEAYRFAPV